jgi:formylglycine-generating enzyme required for sulfatase activity
MQRRWRWAGVVLMFGLAGVGALLEPVAWAEREKKPPTPKPPSGPGAKVPGPVSPKSGAMVKIEGGSFSMGSQSPAAFDNEKPAHAVKVATFYMDKTEVTVDAYKACVTARGCSKPSDGEECNWGKDYLKQHPINCVDWNQATSFCKWAGKRLPTEEEWEFAAKPPGGDNYPWGDEMPGDRLCWRRHPSDTANRTCAVGDHPSGNTLAGLNDMAGNVSEWTANFYCPYSSTGYEQEKCNANHVGRGGSWYSEYASDVRAARRTGGAPTDISAARGFRCARSE